MVRMVPYRHSGHMEAQCTWCARQGCLTLPRKLRFESYRLPVNNEEKDSEIQALSAEVESIIKYSHLPARNGEKPKTFTNIGAASSAVQARCRKIIRLKEGLGARGKVSEHGTTELMKRAGIDLNKKA